MTGDHPDVADERCDSADLEIRHSFAHCYRTKPSHRLLDVHSICRGKSGEEAAGQTGPYDVVLLCEQALSPEDARQVTSLHQELEGPVTYHVLLPVEDAAARVEAAMGSLAAGEVMASPAMVMNEVDLDQVRQDCLDRSKEELKTLERDATALERVVPPFPRITYTEAIERLNRKGNPIPWGDDFGADEETLVAEDFDRPVMVSRFPAAFKAFYMQPDPENPKVVLGLDILAPEGYGEIIGGSQRIHDHDFLLERIRSHDLPVEAFQWYLDVRKYGSCPHAGFGMGLERFVAWMGKLEHVRETIPYPRMLYKIYP